MAVLRYTLIAVMLTILPYVENAPSAVDDTSKRLIFADSNVENVINSDQSTTVRRLPANSPTLESNLAGSKPIVKQAASRRMPQVQMTKQAETSGNLQKMDDERQNWGIVMKEANFEQDESLYNRPIALPKYDVKQVSFSKPMEVEKKVTVTTPVIPTVEKKLNPCNVATVVCCGKSEKLVECLRFHACFVDEEQITNVCTPESINKSFSNLLELYGNIPN